MAMAASSSLFTCSFQEGMCSSETKSCSKNFMCNCLNLTRKKLGCSKSMHLGQPKFLHNEESLMLEGIRRLSKRQRFLCQAVEIENPPSFTVGKKFQLDDVIEAQQFDRDILNAIFEVARDMEKIEKNSPGSQILKGYLMATLFYEPSTRTRLSFESAMKHLGGEVLTTENAREFSSAAKGETLEGDPFHLLYRVLDIIFPELLVILILICR